MPGLAALPCLSPSHCCPVPCLCPPPRKKPHYGTHPLPGRSLPSHSGCCASSAIPPLAASRLRRPSSSPACLCPIPAPSLRAAMTAKSAGRQRDAAMRGAPAPLWYCCFTDACSLPESCRGGGCSLPCARMSRTVGSCGHLHPPAASSGTALPAPAAPRGADPLSAAAGQGMPSPAGPAARSCHSPVFDV